MTDIFVEIEVPPVGQLETEGGGTAPTDEQMAEESAAREQLVDALRPYLSSLPGRPPRRAGNVSRVQLLGGNTWSNLNRYAAIVTVDIGDPGLEEGLRSVLPAGSTLRVSGEYAFLDEWSSSTDGA